MRSYRSFLFTCLFAAVAFSTAKADTFNAMYVFGDSLSDVGNAYIATGGTMPASPPYSNGRFSNGNIWVQDLATQFNLPAVQASLAGGNDYAVGGATTSSTGVGNLGWQLSQFAAANPVANPNGLYMIWIGANDVDGIVASHSPTPQTAAQAVVATIDSAIQTLVGEGAHNFLVVGVPDLGKVPGAIENGPPTEAATSALSQYFNSALAASLNTVPGEPNITFMDTYSLMDNVVNDPSAYGLTNVDTPCLSVDAQNQPLICSNPNQYLFWDVIHPTAAGQQLIASAALQAIPETAVPEPATWTMLLGGVGILGLAAAKRQ
jgi:phospholipase/lecithinase/hemolysin